MFRFSVTALVLANMLLLFASIISLTSDGESPTTFLSPSEMSAISDSCTNKTMFESAGCVNKIVKQIYHYNISTVGKKLSFYELLKQGGVCDHWANLYCLVGDELGYYTELVQVTTEQINSTYQNKTDEWEISHVFCVWSGKEGYIVLDQRKMFSFHYAESNRTEVIDNLRRNNEVLSNE